MVDGNNKNLVDGIITAYDEMNVMTKIVDCEYDDPISLNEVKEIFDERFSRKDERTLIVMFDSATFGSGYKFEDGSWYEYATTRGYL